MKYMEEEIKQSSELKKFQKYYSHNRIVLIGYSWAIGSHQICKSASENKKQTQSHIKTTSKKTHFRTHQVKT